MVNLDHDSIQLVTNPNEKTCGIISAYSTDDRKRDDIDCCRGCVATPEALSRSSRMLFLSSGAHQHGRRYNEHLDRSSMDRTSKQARQRSKSERDEYWRHGSIFEDFSRTRCPGRAILGHWVDQYAFVSLGDLCETVLQWLN